MPLSQDEIVALWQQPESERTEWKPSFSQVESLYRTICAFANDFNRFQKPCVIFVGRNDDGTCSQAILDDATIREFVGDVRESGAILPIPNISFQPLTIENCAVIALIVEPSQSTPVSYGGTVYVRVGPTTRKAKPDEITLLAKKRTTDSFDLRSINGAELSDLDMLYLREVYIPKSVSKEVLDENERTLEEQLAALRILTPTYQPTYLGILIAGKRLRYYLPGAYVQFLRVDGNELGDPVKDHQEISGRMGDMIERVMDKIKANINYASHFGNGVRDVGKPDYPFDALRELVVNAVVHRDYEHSNAPTRVNWFNDRIEIHNPGGPFGRVNEQNFGQPNVTDYRNPELANALKNLGYVQRFGYGIALATKQLLKNANPAPQFEAKGEGNYVLATVRPHGHEAH
jgi:ATP-dependent DNA helicase RecG